MKLLLDTHVLIYLTIQRNSLSAQAQTLIADPTNDLYLSMASVWEMQIKLQIGKLNLQPPLPQIIADQQQVNGMQLLSISPQHIYHLSQLPFHHKDPFDRLLISQAITEGLALLSNDTKFAAYGANVIW
jgi:PIN domain nuclease of toxin-antitoxin system